MSNNPTSTLLGFREAIETGYTPRCKHCIYCDKRILEYTPPPEEMDRAAFEAATRGKPSGFCRVNPPDKLSWTAIDIGKTYCGAGVFNRSMMASDKLVEKLGNPDPDKEQAGQ